MECKYNCCTAAISCFFSNGSLGAVPPKPTRGNPIINLASLLPEFTFRFLALLNVHYPVFVKKGYKYTFHTC